MSIFIKSGMPYFLKALLRDIVLSSSKLLTNLFSILKSKFINLDSSFNLSHELGSGSKRNIFYIF